MIASMPRVRFASQSKANSMINKLNEEDYTYAINLID